MSKKDILDGAHEENPALLKRMTSVLKKLPTQRAFWTDVKTKVEAMVFEFGPTGLLSRLVNMMMRTCSNFFVRRILICLM